MRVGLVGLSNPVSNVETVVDWLQQKNMEVIVSKYMSGDSTPIEKAREWNQWMKESALDWIFDLSGGDLANTVIPYLDIDCFRQSKTQFAGYSDLTCVLNYLYKKTNKPCLLFQIRNHGLEQEVVDYFYKKNNHLCTLSCDFSTDQTSIVVGGNIRCLLKLAGTEDFPDVKDKILLLESYSGSWYRIQSYLAQLERMQVFHQAQSVLLGQFTELDREGNRSKLLEYPFSCGLGCTLDIGHSYYSKAIWIGKEIHITKNLIY